MKLLLTSAGISNDSIATALNELAGKLPSEIKVGYVPISANGEAGNKDWVIKDFLNFWRYGYNWIDIVDPSAPGADWQKRLTDVDIVAFSGGNTFHLLHEMRKSGLDKWLKGNLKSKVYFGGSASSVLAGPTIGVGTMEVYKEINFSGVKDLSALNLVNFEIAPHSPRWASYESVEEYAKTIKNKVYALDDMSAIKVDGDKVEVVSEGAWKVFNK